MRGTFNKDVWEVPIFNSKCTKGKIQSSASLSLKNILHEDLQPESKKSPFLGLYGLILVLKGLPWTQKACIPGLKTKLDFH